MVAMTVLQGATLRRSSLLVLILKLAATSPQVRPSVADPNRERELLAAMTATATLSSATTFLHPKKTFGKELLSRERCPP